MKKIVDLTQGDILRQIIKLSLPIIGASFVQMAYNMTDMAWLGQVGSETVSAVGVSGYMLWMGVSLIYITKIGAEVKISQSIGKKNYEDKNMFANTTILLSLILATAFALVTFLFSKNIVSFYNFEKESVVDTAVSYLRIISIGFIFNLSNQTFTGVFNGIGNTKMPFLINAIGLGLNMILDPLLIFGFSFIPAMGADGAGYATVLSQLLVFVIFIKQLKAKSTPLKIYFKLNQLTKKYVLSILKVGVPIAVQNILFASIAIVLIRVLTGVCQGDARPVSVQTLGAQIESISWLTISGVATALGTFIGQNFGARNWLRIKKGFYITLLLTSIIGVLNSILFFVFGDKVFVLFMRGDEVDVIKMGIVYLKIIAFSQIFMCIEIAVSGAFYGLNNSKIPSVVSLTFNILRIPMAIYLSSKLLGFQLPDFGYNLSNMSVTGVWWAISITTFLKGTILCTWFVLYLNKKLKRYK